MFQFKDFKIEQTNDSLIGDKIKVERLLGKEIIVEKFKIEDSKKFAGEKCLHMQILKGEDRHVIFTSALSLIDMIQRVPEDKFPFKTTIIKPNDRFVFS